MKAVTLLLFVTAVAFGADTSWKRIDEGFQFLVPPTWIKMEVRCFDSHCGTYKGPSAYLEFDEVTALGESPDNKYLESLKKKEADTSLRGAKEEIWRIDGRVASVTFEAADSRIYGKREHAFVARMTVPYQDEPISLGVLIFYSNRQEEVMVRTILESFKWPKSPTRR